MKRGRWAVIPSVRLPHQPAAPMDRDLQTRFFAVFLALLSVAAIVFAWINFQKDREILAPYDGVWWVEDGGHLRAERVDADGPGQKAGIKPGDRLVAVDGRDVTNVGSLERQLYRVGVWSKATYSLVRQGVPLEAPLILAPADRSLYGGLRLIALVYLGIGMYVLLRRWTAPKSTHFYVFCLVSFIFYSFHYTGKLNDFDWIVYWSNVVAWLLQPALFLHFSLTFPERKGAGQPAPLADPGGVCARARFCWRCTSACIDLLQPSELLRWNLDRVEWVYLAAYFVAGGGHVVAQLPPCRVGDPAPADEVGHARHHSVGRALHAVLHHPLPVRQRARPGDEGLRAVAGVPAADLRLRHLPLPPDGRGPDLQARHGLHHRRRRHHGSLFRRGRRGFGAVPPELPQRRADRAGGGHRGHRAAVRSLQELGAGVSRQVFLSQAL